MRNGGNDTVSAVDRLPTWQLQDLYAAPEDPAIDRDLSAARRDAEEFHAEIAGRLAQLDGSELGRAIARYEAIVERLNRALSFAQLVFSEDMGDPARGRFLQSVQERANAVTLEILFFTLELNDLDDAVLAGQLEDPAAAHYATWIRDSRLFRPHQLSADIEAVLHEKELTGRSAWVRLFEQTIATLSFQVDGATLGISEVLNQLSDPDASRRRAAAEALGAGLGEKVELFTLITNTLAKDKEIDDRMRRYATPVSYRNLSNRVEDEVVDALVEATRGAYDELAHRYYAIKARWFGGEVLDYWDRNAPLPGARQRTFGWEEARSIVLDSFEAFDPRMAEIAQRFFEEGWIDAAPRPGKDPGAFAHPTVPSAHPYVLLNFYGRSRDVTTLAHELGHGVHQVLAARHGTLMSETPLTLAETASVFGEMLVFRALLDRERDPEQRKRLLAGKVEDMLNTVVRQTAFFVFERRVHEERRQGELSADRLGEIWLDVQNESLGPAVKFHDEYRDYWSYIPHFVHSPFYVYAYAFGDCLVNALYRVYQRGLPGFTDTYIDMLRAGGTRRHSDLLGPFGLDARDPGFWRQGLDVIVDLIDELEALP